MKKNIVIPLTLAASVCSLVVVDNAYASTKFELRKRTIGISGIMQTSTKLDDKVTRAEFAQMLVKASSFKGAVSQISNISLFSDVLKNHPEASYIRLAVDNGWMNGYLGGVFKPDEPITLQEAVKGVLGLLGYVNADFTGDQVGARLAKYYDLKLDDEIKRDKNEILTKADCINLFYNLLTAKNKDGKEYATVLGYTLTSDKEVNPFNMVDKDLIGPKLVKKSHNLSDILPFSVDDASIFLNGEPSSTARLKQVLDEDKYYIVYYNKDSKSVWAYSETANSDASRKIVRGTITHIYYKSTEVLTPSGVVLDGSESESDNEEDASGTIYKIDSTEMQFAFSIYGTLKVGDDVALICQTTTNSEGDSTYTVIDYIED